MLVTIKELSKYHNIKIEIEQLNDNLKNLDNTSISSPKLTDIPHGTSSADSPVENLVIKKSKLESILEKKKTKLLDEQLKIENFLKTVEDSTIRIIIRARFIDGENWKQIADKLHFERTTPYNNLKKYLKSRSENEKE